MDIHKYQALYPNFRRMIGILIIALSFVIPFAVIPCLNPESILLSTLFFLGALLLSISMSLSGYTGFRIAPLKLRAIELPPADTDIAILLPIYNESREILHGTLSSVLEQDYLHRHMYIFVGNDGGQEEISILVRDFAKKFPEVKFRELFPPRKGSALREQLGAGKAGVLNHCLKILREEYPELNFLETRDCDDKVGSQDFLRQCIYFLKSNPQMALVQTYKMTTNTEAGYEYRDPSEVFFQVGLIPSRIRDGAIFSMGSGVVYRLAALQEIGGFVSWSPSEDMTTSAVLLNAGWKTGHLAILGAVTDFGRDLHVMYGQFKNWIPDVMLLVMSRQLSRLNLRQKAQFWEIASEYILRSLAEGILFITLLAGLVTGAAPLMKVPFPIGICLWASAILFMAWPFVLAGKYPKAAMSYLLKRYLFSLHYLKVAAIFFYRRYKKVGDTQVHISSKNVQSRHSWQLFAWPLFGIILLSLGLLFSWFHSAPQEAHILRFFAIVWLLVYVLTILLPSGVLNRLFSKKQGSPNFRPFYVDEGCVQRLSHLHKYPNQK